MITTFTEFVESPYFIALEVFLVCFVSALCSKIMKYSNLAPSGIISRKTNAVFLKIIHWTNNACRFPKVALDLRKSWALKRADKPFQRDTSLPNANPFMMMLPMLANFGPTLLINFYLQAKPALRLPFEIPPQLRSFFQYGLPPNLDADNHIVGAFSFYFVMNLCSQVFINFIPMASEPKETYGPNSKIHYYADTLVVTNEPWELENADQELLDMIDQKLKKHE